MSQRDPEKRGGPLHERRDRILLILGLAIAAAMVLALAVALVIHFVLLSTDRFNWLEAPKRSDLVSPTRIACILPRASYGGGSRGQIRASTRRPAGS